MSKFCFLAVAIPLSVMSFDALSAEFTEAQLCKAAISVEMGKKPRIMKTKASAGIVDLQYIRPDDGTLWKYQCKIINGNQIMWRTAGDHNTPNRLGRWRDNPMDSTIKYSVSGSTLTISESDLGDTKFKLSELK